jgi:hypothetical protein
MSESDFVNITHNGELCNAKGEIGQGEFQAIMRREVLPRERKKSCSCCAPLHATLTRSS